MSSGERIRNAKAAIIGASFLDHISYIAGRHVIAGSVRRKQKTVGDIEIVSCPVNRAALLSRLDSLVQTGFIEKSLYGGATRWGSKLRGFIFQGVAFEVTITDKAAYGYQLWLRTGPGDKNHYVMSQMLKFETPVRFTGGYAYHVSYDSSRPDYEAKLGFAKLAKLAVPDEWRLYHLLGMEYVPAPERSEQHYRRFLSRGVRTPALEEIRALYAEDDTPTQMSMF